MHTKTLEVLARPFERFFNYGEAPENSKNFELSRSVAYDKIDGSLIKVWCDYSGIWRVGTRGTAYAEGNPQGWEITFEELVCKALNTTKEEFNSKCSELTRGFTYLFELTSRENRVVTTYKDTSLWYLGCIENSTGIDFSSSEDIEQIVSDLGARIINKRFFSCIQDCLDTANALPDLKEGYVLYDAASNTRIKVKSPAYVAVHHIRGEGINPKRIKELVR